MNHGTKLKVLSHVWTCLGCLSSSFFGYLLYRLSDYISLNLSVFYSTLQSFAKISKSQVSHSDYTKYPQPITTTKQSIRSVSHITIANRIQLLVMFVGLVSPH